MECGFESRLGHIFGLAWRFSRNAAALKLLVTQAIPHGSP